MLYKDCKLYQLRSKKLLKYYLKITVLKLVTQKYIVSCINPFIDKSKVKPRLIEAPSPEIKRIQTNIKKWLGEITVPSNIFSGIKGRSYADNAFIHKGEKYLYKIDISAFFPSIKRETVYQFFRTALECSQDVAEILTNLTTIDLDISKAVSVDEIFVFLEGKHVITRNHLSTVILR